MEDKIKNSEEYLNSKLGKENGFSIPKNYFKTFDKVIEERLPEVNLTNKNSFKVPETYFKNLEDEVLAKVSSPKTETKVISFKERVFKFIPISAAAAILLFVGLNSFIFNKTEELNLDSLSDVDIEYWLDSNTLSTYDITFAIEDDLLEDDDFYFATLDDENIENYINSIENNSILEELN